MVAYETLGFDPVAASESVGRDIARELRDTVARLGEVDEILTGSGQQEWRGEAADAFRASVDRELRPRVHDAYLGFAQASRAVDGWVEDLHGYRRRADALEVEAREAAERAASRADRDGIVDRARALRSEVEDHAGRVAASLRTAIDLVPDGSGPVGAVGGLLADLDVTLGELVDWALESFVPRTERFAHAVGAVVLQVASSGSVAPGAGRDIGSAAVQAESGLRNGVFVPQVALTPADTDGGFSWGLTRVVDVVDGPSAIDEAHR